MLGKSLPPLNRVQIYRITDNVCRIVGSCDTGGDLLYLLRSKKELSRF
jgi:hypothetical protein